MSLLDTQRAIEEAAARTGPAVIGLRRGARRGSGVLVGDARAVTLARNLRDDDLTVALGDGSEVSARVLGVDREVDLALLELESASGGRPLDLRGDAGEPEIGTAVIALADPAGRGLRVTAGHVSAAPRTVRGPRGRLLHGIVEHTVPLPRGAGGGPLVDLEGRLVGLNSVRLEGGFILALPARVVRERLQALATGRGADAPRLGVAIVSPRAARRLRAAVGLPEQEGLLVRAVEPGSPADRAQLARGDLIVAAGERPVTSIDDLYAALDTLRDGGTLALTLLRGAEEHRVDVALGEPAEQV